MKKLLLSFLLFFLPLLASAESVEINGIYFNLTTKTKTAEVTSNPNKYSGSVVIPKTIQFDNVEYTVIAIGNKAFYKCLNLTSVDLPNSVTLIDEDAFTDCYGLTSIDIPNSVTTISYFAFENCKGLVSIILPNSVTKVAMGAFDGCSNLKSVTLPDKLVTISNIVFNGCVSLSSITIPASVTTIETIAFHGCKSLTSIIIPKTVTKIGENSFKGCSGLTSIIVEAGNPVYDSRNNCNAIIRTDDNKLIAGCYNTQIPNTVTSIGSCAFNGFSDLTSMTIPNNVTSIEGNAFEGCSGMISLKVESGNKKYDSRNNCNAIIETESNTLIIGCKNTIIPSSVTSIGNSAFSRCHGLSSITIPNSVTSIGGSAFYGCSGLTSITIPDNVTSIGDGAFIHCNNIQSITIPASLTSIGMSVFSDCTLLNNFYCLAENPPSTDTYSFSLTPLEKVTLHVPVESVDAYNEVEPWKNFKEIVPIVNVVEIDDIWYSIITKDNIAVVTCNPNGDKYSGDVSIPEKIVYNEKQFPVSKIGDKAFYACKSMTSINIPSSVTSIGEEAFSGCSGLTSITIPSSVTSMGDFAFSGCIGLTSIAIPNSLTSISRFAFCGASIPSITIPGNITSIGGNAFEGCTSLTSTTFLNGVKTIGREVFEGCNILTTITIPQSMSFIDEEAFSWCYILTDVYCFAEQLSTNSKDNSGLYADSDAFIGSLKQATLHVPKGCLDAYKAIEPWKSFNNIVEMVDAKVKLSKSKATIQKGKTLTLKATITPSDLPDKSVTWKSSNTKVATVTSKGKVKGVKAGTATITCTSNATGLKATCKVTVENGLVTLNKTEAYVQKGKTMTLKATVSPETLADKSVIWESSDKKIATVTKAGKVKGVKAGTATITCTSKATGAKATCKVTVGYVKLDKTEAVINKGKTLTLKATVYPSKLEDKSVTWKSSNKKVATVTSKGKVKGVKAGTATITCTSNATGLKTTCEVTVGYVQLDQTEVTVKKGKALTLKATVYPSSLEDKSVTWESSNTKVATVTSKGKVKGVKAGTATITCISNATGLSTTCIVKVTATTGTRSMEGDDNDELTEIDEVEVSAAIKPFDVYDLGGRKVLHQVTSLDGLPDGIYIVNGKKILKKK